MHRTRSFRPRPFVRRSPNSVTRPKCSRSATISARSANGSSRSRPDLVFNLVESLAGSDATAVAVPAMLDGHGIRYTGSRAASTALSNDKCAAKDFMTRLSLPTPEWVTLDAAVARVSQRPLHREGALRTRIARSRRRRDRPLRFARSGAKRRSRTHRVRWVVRVSQSDSSAAANSTCRC